MNRCWSLLMVGLLMTNAACSVSGAIRENFHQAGEAPPRKIPLKVGLVPDKLATQRLSVGATGTIDIELQPGVFNAVKAEWLIRLQRSQSLKEQARRRMKISWAL